jgi:hypothetical protein
MAFAIGLAACGGLMSSVSAGDAGIGAGPIDAGDDALAGDAGARSTGDAACPDGESGDGAGEASIVDAGTCSAQGALAISGDYTAADGTRHWLRKSATASTYTVVPPGMPVPSALPRLFRIESVCSSQWMLLESTDGAYGRLDWATVGSSLSICVRTVSDASAAVALTSPDPGAPATGCAGSAWTALTKVTP